MKFPSLSVLIFLCTLLPLGATQSYQISDAVAIKVNSETGAIEVYQNSNPVLEIDSILFDYTKPIGVELSPATEDKIIIKLKYPSSVDYQHHANDLEDREAAITVEPVPGGIRFYSDPKWSNQVTILLKDTKDHQFGLTEPLQPDNQLSPDLRGKVIDMEVKSDGQTIVENYASAFSSLYMSSAGYGAFFDTFARGRYQFATYEGQHKIHHETGKLDWYLFFGKNGTEILSSYYQLIGEPKSVPIWAMGPVLWRDDNDGGSAQILDDVQQFDDLRIPATSWFVDRPYSDGGHRWSKMNFSEEFQNPQEWIRTLNETHGVQFMTWTSTAFFGDPRFNHHLDDWHTYLDLSDPESVKAFQQELKEQQYVHGVKGHKMDRADENFPLYSSWHDKSVTEPFRRNTYVYLFAKTHHEALEASWGSDQFNFARAAIHRVQPYLSAIWGGDPRSSWDGFQGNFANGIRAGFMGFPIWGSDVGGYLGDGDIPEDLYIRWLQAGSMSGLFEIKLDGAGGDGNDRMPWHYPESLQNVFRKVCEDRMALLPTLYSLANTSSTTGVLNQPMAYADLSDPETYSIWDQFLIGDAILVAPVFEKSNHRKIYLPKGQWHEMDAPEIIHEGGQWIEKNVPIEQLPRFVRANSIYLTGNIYRGSDRNWNNEPKHLNLNIFPGAAWSSYTFTFVDPNQSETRMDIELSNGETDSVLKIPELPYETTLLWYGQKKPRSIECLGKKLDWKPLEFGYSLELTPEQLQAGLEFAIRR